MSIAMNVVNASSAIKGQIISVPRGIEYHSVFATINKDSTETFNFGTVLKIVGVSGDRLIVDKATSTTDEIFGVISFDKSNHNLKAGASVTVIKGDCLITVEASEAIALGDLVEIVPTGDKVAVKNTGKLYGKARGVALADGDLITIEMPHALDI